MRLFFLLALCLTVFACGESTDADVDTQTAAEEMADETATRVVTANTEAMTFLSTTVQAVQDAGGDITALSPEAATSNVNGWISKLEGVEGAEPILEDLANLKKEFMLGSDGELNGGNISLILASMADNTRAVSDKAKGLDMLANVLDAGAEKLAGK